MTIKLKVAYSDDAGAKSRIDELIDNYRSADKCSQIVLDKATKVLAETNDASKVAQANRAIRLSMQIANEAFLEISNARSKNLEGVLAKLNLWQECAIGTSPESQDLSPIEMLLCSVVGDISRLSKG